MDYITPYFSKNHFEIFNGDSLQLLKAIPDNTIDLIFSDPPYMLSNNGQTCSGGKFVSVNKGEWDKSKGVMNDFQFHNEWITECKRILKPSGTIWISGTYHNIYQCGFLLQLHNFKILNEISWFKPNASPNLSCRMFTASHETLIWARKEKKVAHTFNYKEMKTGEYPEDRFKIPDKQMRSVWCIPATPKKEKTFGKHPTQKPIELLKRIITASSSENDIILDVFNGSGTTGVAAAIVGNRKFIGLEIDPNYCELAKQRIENELNK